MINRQLHLIGKSQLELRVEDTEFSVGHGEVLIRIAACGFCGTDLSYALVMNHTPDDSIVLGHEFSGFVEKTGDGAAGLAVGDLVVVEPGIHCGSCEQCLLGNPNLCVNAKFFGYPPIHGGFQNRIVFPAQFCFKIAKSVDPVDAVLVEPLAVCLHTMNLAKTKIGSDAMVLGAGPIGLMLIKLLKKAGALKVFVSEPLEYRRKLAESCGADFVLNPAEEDIVERVMAHTDNKGVEKVFEAAGSAESMAITTKVAKQGATILMIGIPKDDTFPISHSQARKKGLTLKMVRTINNTVPVAIKLMEEGLDLSDIITHRLSMEEAVQCFSEIQKLGMDAVKTVVIPE